MHITVHKYLTVSDDYIHFKPRMILPPTPLKKPFNPLCEAVLSEV
jgi:hypothetical protein